jgi:hypothetical protein
LTDIENPHYDEDSLTSFNNIANHKEQAVLLEADAKTAKDIEWSVDIYCIPRE